MTNEGKIGAAVVGLGLVAAEHIKAYQADPHCEIVAFCSRDKNRAQVRAEQLGLKNCRAYSDIESMLRQEDIDVVSICTPNNFHVEQGIAVARAGKALVIEKPIALDIEGARRLERAVAQAGVKSVVCFVLHWYPQFVNQAAMVDAGTVGDVFFVDCEYLHGGLDRYPSQWRWIWKKSMGGSTLLQGGIHAIDAMCRFLPAAAEEVTAYTHQHTDAYEYPPSIVGVVKFADGAVGKLTSSFETVMPYQLNLRLYGTRGTIQNGRLWSEVIAPNQSDWAEFPAVGADSGDPSHHPFTSMVAHIVDCILHDRSPFPSVGDALRSHEIVFAADLSAAEGRPVRLPL